MKAMKGMGRRFVALSLMLVLVVSSYYAITWGIADIHAQSGYEEMASWDSAPVSESSWQRAFGEISRAHELDPTHPVYLQRLARLHRIQMTTQLVPVAELDDVGALARSYLAKSIKLRPNWGFTWAEMAYVKWLLNERDETFHQAIDNATKFGPWEPEVIAMISFLGVMEYQRSDDSLQRVLLGNLVRGLRSPSVGLFENTFERVQGRQDLRGVIVSEMYPFLGEQVWRKSVRYNFFRLADWAWSEFDEAKQLRVVEQTLVVIRQLEIPYAWIKSARNPGFKTALCVAARNDKPDDQNVKAWCGFGD